MPPSDVHVIPREEHEGEITYDEALAVTRETLIEWAEHPEYSHTRRRINLPSGVRTSVFMAAVPALGGIGVFEHTSSVSVVGNEQKINDHAPKVGVLHDAETSELQAIFLGGPSGAEYPATTGTALRTACISAVGADALAREDATVLGLLGSGKQARTQLVALDAVRDFDRCRVYSPTRANREHFAEEMDEYVSMDVEAVDDTAAAVGGADVVSAATNAADPVLDGDLLEAGQTVLSIVGSNVQLVESGNAPSRRREIDDATIDRADLYVTTSVEQAREYEQGDFYVPVERGILQWDEVVPLTDVLRGVHAGRESDDQIVLFKNNVGVPMVDIALLSRVWENIRDRDPGVSLRVESQADEFAERHGLQT